MYLQTDQAYDLDSQIDFMLTFGTPPINVRCYARVVRVEPRGDHIGIAAVITSVVFA